MMNDDQAASGAVAGLPSVSPERIAVTGRQKLYVYLASHALIPASAIAMFRRANRRALSSSAAPVVATSSWAM